LKEDRLRALSGDVRDKKDSITTFSDTSSGMEYNEIISKRSGTLAVCVRRQSAGEVGKMHQNVLVFYKGNPKNKGELP
jgi:hypothetical protein